MAKTIMIVDDDEMNLRMADFILGQKGYITIKVTSGMECWSRLQQERVDLILLDIEMPIMNGIKTFEKIRSKEEYADIPVMFLTASADSETVLEVGKMGAVDYIKKPFMPQDLLDRVGKVLG